MVIPFDPNTKKQAQDQVKYGLGAGIEYQNFRMNVGEIIPDSPLTPQVDTHQLRVNYKGLELKYKTPQQNFELGLINRYSPKMRRTTTNSPYQNMNLTDSISFNGMAKHHGTTGNFIMVT